MTRAALDITTIDYSEQSLWYCLNTGVINQMFTSDITQGKWDGARGVRVADNLLRWSMATLLARPEFAQNLTHLDLREVFLEPEALDALIQNPALCKLESLELGRVSTKHGNALGGIVRSPHLTSLTHLGLECATLVKEEFDALAHSDHDWTHLSFRKVCSEDELVPWLSSTSFPDLNAVDLSGCTLGRSDIEALITSPWIPHLTELTLDNTTLEPLDLSALCTPADASSMALRCLSVSSNWWKADAWSYALEHLDDTMPELTSLDVSHNTLGAHGLKALLIHPLSHGLRELVLRYIGFDDAAMDVWCQHARLEHLHTLSLSSNKGIGDRGAMQLATHRHTPALEALAIRSCGVTKSGVQALFDAEHFRLDPMRCDVDP